MSLNDPRLHPKFDSPGPTKWRKKPVVIKAWKLTTKDLLRIAEWCGGQARTSGRIIIPTLEGDMTAEPGDWIIQGVQGEFYACRDDIFRQTYEAAG